MFGWLVLQVTDWACEAACATGKGWTDELQQIADNRDLRKPRMQVAANINESLLSSIGAGVPEVFPSSAPSSFTGFKIIRCNGVAVALEPARILVAMPTPLGGLDRECDLDSCRRRVCTE